MSPDCYTWLVFLTRSSYKRASSAHGVFGDLTQLEVRLANDTADLVSYYLVLAWSRHVYTGLENPLSALLFKHDVIKGILQCTHAKRVICYAGGFGSPSLKPLEFYVTIPRASEFLAVNRPQAYAAFEARGCEPISLATNDGGSVQGTGDTLASAEYPETLCQRICDAAQAALSSP